MATPETSLTKTMGHVEELRQVASLDQCAWDYAQKLMRSSADEIERLDADAAGAQAELASVKACWAEALENVATRNREIEQLRQERHQLRNELTAERLEGEQLRAAMRKALNVWDNYRITDTETEQAIKAECEALVGAAAEPGVQHTYDVVAYSASGQTGYGQNDSKEGFTSADEAIAYAKSCDAYLNATVWQRTKPSPVAYTSVQIYPAVNAVKSAPEPEAGPVASPSHSLIALYAGCLCEWCKNERAKSALKS